MAQPEFNLRDLKPLPKAPMPQATVMPAQCEPASSQGEVIYEAPRESDAIPRRRSLARSLGRALGDGLNFLSGYLLTNLTSGIAFILFRVLNRTRVHNRSNFGLARNTLICANHRTMIDSYMLGHLSSWPWGWLLPRVLPYHPAASENFFRNPVIGWFSARWRCIPVRRGVKDFDALSVMSQTLPKGQMLIFPEGTRSRDGKLREGRPGTGKLIHDTRCKVVPVYHRGMHKVLPIGTSFPRFWKRIDVYVGSPIDMSDLFALPSSKETSRLVIDRVMEALHGLEAQADADEAARVPWTVALPRALRRALPLPYRR
ncbi:MAG: lysophospholipid acyltransferase family protein [Polyangia bacterium]|jgi:1-acyl-sn-glycerol-3-phosphate acyltransferase|nr:lysophospholipid acyltransferase family protein [Polyangia bacterium]